MASSRGDVGLAPARQLDQTEAPYLDALAAHAARAPGRYHVPGHKGGAAAERRVRSVLGDLAFAVDVPAYVQGIDIGPEPTPLTRSLELAADAWGAEQTWFLTGGASEGAQAACLAFAREGATAVVQRNVHVSTVHGLVLSGLHPHWVAPVPDADLGLLHCLTPDALDDALRRAPEATAAFVVSPTYFGATADVRGLAEVAHAHGAALVVDEAWGAHFAFHPSLPEDALSAGADLVLSGTHKMVGSLTQSAMLHIGAPSERLDPEDVNRALALVQSTSPSALLLASLDAARRLAAVEGEELIERSMGVVSAARRALRELHGVDVLDERLLLRPSVAGFDPLRLTVDVRATGLDGHALGAAMARDSDVHLELVTQDVLVAHCGMAEGEAVESPDRLCDALAAAVGRVSTSSGGRRRRFARAPLWGDLAMTPREAVCAAHDRVTLVDAAGRVAAESLSLYPPGTATILPGERVTQATVDHIVQTLGQGGRLRGSADPGGATLRVVRERVEAEDPAAAVTPARPEESSLAVGESVFAEFPARAYLEKYYGGVGPENATLLRSITSYLTESGAPTDTVVEVAGGPSLFSIMAVAAVRGAPFDRVLFTDVGAQNLAEVEEYVVDGAGQFDYAHLFEWLRRETGATREGLARIARRSAWEISRFDWREEPPAEWRGRFDLVSSHFFAESATRSEQEFLEMLARVPALGRPGGTLLMSFMSRSRGYRIAGTDFPAFDVSESSILGWLERAGVPISEVVLRTCPAEDPDSGPGYEGLVFVAGRLPG